MASGALKLTLAEARALYEMASQVAWHSDILAQEFPNGNRRACAERAFEKLARAARCRVPWAPQKAPIG